MKNKLLTTAVVVLLALFLFGMKTDNKHLTKGEIEANNLSGANQTPGFALVELFTSEGCSSCPPADELVNKLAKEKIKNVIILSYHVDYWNRLGWKDKFSRAEFTQRQQQYAMYFKKDGVYTPQIVVNGKTEFIGSDETKLNNVINKTVNASYISPIQIKATIANNAIAITYNTDHKIPSSINIALIQLAGSSQVATGENAGRFLQHINIVTDIKTITAGTNKKDVIFSVPPSKAFSVVDYKVVAFLQNDDGSIIAATETNIR